jgi:hypothetical protein
MSKFDQTRPDSRRNSAEDRSEQGQQHRRVRSVGEAKATLSALRQSMTGATTAVLAQSKTSARPQRETSYQQNSNPLGTGDAKRDLNQNPTLRLTGNQVTELDRSTGISEPQAIDLREASMGRSPFAIATNFMLHVAPVNGPRLVYPAEFPPAESDGNGSGDASRVSAIADLVNDPGFMEGLKKVTLDVVRDLALTKIHARVTESRGPGLGSTYEDARRGHEIFHPPTYRRWAA